MPAYGRIDLDAILDSHRRWLDGDPKAKCADLRGADMAKVNIVAANLRRANLSRANLESADARGADFTGANLSGANLHRAKIDGAKFNNAVLSRCFAAYVRFKNVDLTGCDLTRADLTMAEMDEAIWGNDWASNLQHARLRIAPEGDLIGWKQLRNGEIAKLLIPAAARRSNSFSRRCRAEYVEVLSVITEGGSPLKEGTSKRDAELVYRVGERTKADAWDDCWWRDCSHGIHFFLTYEEAAAL